MLQRLWDPVEGRVLIDGQDLRDVTLESLRRAIGVVFQESMLFNRTIRDNRADRQARVRREEELERACRMADAHEFIIRQPHGYDTLVGERGATLSGGQRQRLAIARALLKNPPILILDEATSALDAATEARVGRALQDLMTGRTTFIIAHRLSTVRDADDILVFDGGRVVERGTFRRPARARRPFRGPRRDPARQQRDPLRKRAPMACRLTVQRPTTRTRCCAVHSYLFASDGIGRACSVDADPGGRAMTVAAILQHKGYEVAAVRPTTLVSDVARHALRPPHRRGGRAGCGGSARSGSSASATSCMRSPRTARTRWR